MTAAAHQFQDPRKLHIAFGVAALVHLAVFTGFGISGMTQKKEPTFKIVNIRLGAGGGKLELRKNAEGAAAGAMASAGGALASAGPLGSTVVAPAAAAPPPPSPKPEFARRAVPAPSVKPQPKPVPADNAAAPWRRAREKGEGTGNAPSRTLKQYVAEGDKKSAAGRVLASETDGAVMTRYSQVLALWLYKFREYPPSALAAGDEGQAVIRIRIDRAGRVLYYKLERSTGHPALDAALRDMVYKAAPMPEVPAHYPGGSQLEFQIPIAFSLD